MQVKVRLWRSFIGFYLLGLWPARAHTRAPSHTCALARSQGSVWLHAEFHFQFDMSCGWFINLVALKTCHVFLTFPHLLRRRICGFCGFEMEKVVQLARCLGAKKRLFFVTVSEHVFSSVCYNQKQFQLFCKCIVCVFVCLSRPVSLIKPLAFLPCADGTLAWLLPIWNMQCFY